MSEGSVAGREAYTVRLEVFEGPLDLLLHLIRREEMDIYDIPIARITQQYLDYLEGMAALDLDRASEFLLMAATLMDIKSRMLLPRPAVSEFIDEEAQIDPRRELVARLLEYKRYKEAAGHLARRALTARRVHSRFGGPGGPPAPLAACGGRPNLPPGEPDSESGAGDRLVGVALPDLVASLQRVLREFDRRGPMEVIGETYTVADRLAEIVPLLVKAGERGLDFTDLLRRAGTRHGIVITFLALLELLRRGRVRFTQVGSFGPIRVWALPGLT